MEPSNQMSLSAVAVPAETETTDIFFVEISCCLAKGKGMEMDGSAVVICTSAVTIALTNRISNALLYQVMQETAFV